jgi:SPP1 gp7 family putative phage head morphogenesis protein
VRGDALDRLREELRDAMTLVHMQGLRRESITVERLGVKASVFDAALAALRKRLDMSPRAMTILQQQYDIQAVRILNDVAAKVERGLQAAVYELVGQGATVKEGTKALRKKFDDLGLGDRGDHLIETVFRTQTQLAYGAGRWEADQAPEIQEILWGYQYSAVGDDRTRETHLALDGTVLPKEDPLWERIWPPNGWNCRCQVIPIFEPERERPPPERLPSGDPVTPDAGFDYNPGRVFGRSGVISLAFDPGQPRDEEGTID